MALSAEKVAELKQIIHNQLSQTNIQSKIRQALSDSLSDADAQHRSLGEDQLLDVLKENGVVEDVLRQLHFGSDVQSNRPGNRPTGQHLNPNIAVQKSISNNVDPTRRYLYLQVLSGKAFLEHLHDGEVEPRRMSATFSLHIHFRGQRFSSQPVPCACEPRIEEGFLLELHKETSGDAARMANVSSMLSICDAIHIVLIKTDPSGDRVLMSSHFLEWRSVLSADNNRLTTSLELLGTGSENKVPVGVIDVRLEVMPKTTQILSSDVITTQISLEKGRQSERERLFLVYAKQWWREYLQIRESHDQRLVKLFAQDENGINRPVCSYVKPLRAGRLLDTPRQAARFVSLIGYERVATLGGGERLEQWTNTHAVLARNKGDSEDHATLLCSLLLGFGLDAYVCIGTKAKGAAHAWVVSISTDGPTMFWESLTGNRYTHQPINFDDEPMDRKNKPKYPYRTVGCVFNQKSCYANSQVSDSADMCRFNLRDESQWKAMSTDAIGSVCGPGAIPAWPTLPPLCASHQDSGLLSNTLEHEMRALVVDHRRDMGLTTVWDDQLSYYLTPALAAYELETVTGVSAGNEEFQEAIRRSVPDGHTFKGYPIQFVHRNARRAFSACLRSTVCEDIVGCRGDQIRHALRVRIFLYAENVCATWIMFACKYKSVL